MGRKVCPAAIYLYWDYGAATWKLMHRNGTRWLHYIIR